MKLIGTVKGIVVLLILLIAGGSAMAQGMFYMEVPKEGRIYVFNLQSAYQAFLKTGEVQTPLTRTGEGPNGETLIFDSPDALHLYKFRHNLPDEVIENPAAAESPAVQQKLPYKFSGYMFGDYFYNTSRDPNIAQLPNVAVGGAKDLNGFQFRRIYFTFDDDLASQFSARFRLEADQAALSSDGKISVFVKDAFLRWKNVFGQTDFYFGLQPTPAWEYSEAAWGFRSLEKTIMDLRGVSISRDLAASLRGKLDSSGKYNYWIMIGNGSGNRPESDKFKRAYFHFQWKPNDRFQLTAYQDIVGRPDITDPNNPAATLSNRAFTTAVFAGFAAPEKYSLGLETFWQSTQNGTKLGAEPPFTIENKTARGYSSWAWYSFTPKIGIVGRWDYADPDTNPAMKGDSRNLFIGSFFFRPVKNVYIEPNVIAESYEDLPDGRSIKSSVTPRITLYWVFL